jgi:hypothetical protein
LMRGYQTLLQCTTNIDLPQHCKPGGKTPSRCSSSSRQAIGGRSCAG